MSTRLFSAAINGIDAQLIEVETDSTPGLHSFSIVGLPDKAVEESKDRIASAIRNSGFLPPNSKHRKMVVNLAPADIKKEGPSYDLPIAMGYLFETNQVKFDSSDKLFVGELSLDGTLKHTNGILSIAILAKNKGFKELFVPLPNVKEASVISGIDVIGAKNIKEVLGHLVGQATIQPFKSLEGECSARNIQAEKDSLISESSLLFIKGQTIAKRALVVAAAGSHNIIMSGAPGAGKTILAKALAELLPPLSFEEAIEVARIYSSLGLIKDASLSFIRPFRSPHHTTSAPAIVGGGTSPRPGEISLAHRGVLFLDELPEFPRNVLESLRQPLEDGTITVSRAAGAAILPAKFMLVAAMNPCPCGNYGDERAACMCPPFNVLRYRKKISGPLLDRIDIQINVPREAISMEEREITPADIEEIRKIKNSICSARNIQAERLKKWGILNNSEISFKKIDKLCSMDKEAELVLKDAINSKNLSLRSYHKIKKLALTIADLDNSLIVKRDHMAEAIGLRVNDKMFSELA